MTKRLSATLLTATVAAVWLISISVAAQSPSARPKWTAPRTPWGDPDISGAFTNKDQQGIPSSAIRRLGTRRFLTEQEYAARDEAARARVSREDASFDAEDPDSLPGERRLAARRRRPALGRSRHADQRTSLVVDPPDGRIPPMTVDAQRRPPPRRLGSTGPGPFNGPEDRSLYDRCITRGLPGSMMPAIYGNSYQIVQGPGSVAIRYEMIHETRIIPLDGRPHARPAIRQLHGRRARPLGRQHAGRRDHELHGRSRPIADADATTLQADRALHAGRAGQRRVVGDRRRSARPGRRPWTFAMNLTQDATQPPSRVRVPRGQLRDAQHPQRRARGREGRTKTGAGAVSGVRAADCRGAGLQACRIWADSLRFHDFRIDSAPGPGSSADYADGSRVSHAGRTVDQR